MKLKIQVTISSLLSLRCMVPQDWWDILRSKGQASLANTEYLNVASHMKTPD